MSGLNGIGVVLLEGRMPGEMSDLVRRHGGVPRSVPALLEMPRPDPGVVSTFIDRLVAGDFPVVLCLTGVGVKTLFSEAERIGRLETLLEAMRHATIVCRGQKPAAVLRQNAIPIARIAPTPFTTTEVLAVMTDLKLEGVGVALLHYGERNQALSTAITERGANLEELLLYEWRLPENLQPLRQLVQDLVNGRVEALAITSQVQVRHLYQIARELGHEADLTAALNNATIVASVGPVCTAMLAEYGVTPDVEPTNPKMGPMVVALAKLVEQRTQSQERGDTGGSNPDGSSPS